MGFLSKLFAASSRVKADTLGVLDLTSGSASRLAETDAAALGALFDTVRASTGQPPKCTWLLVYCAIGEDGRIAACDQGLREIIRDSGAPFVVVATPNTGTSYTAAAADTPYGRANLVMTLDRGGDAFARFFRRLIETIKTGKPLPVAWNELAPQVPGRAHDAPQAMAVCELPEITLE